MFTNHERNFDMVKRPPVVSDDPAHDEDMRVLRKEQLAADVGDDYDIPFDDDWDYDA